MSTLTPDRPVIHRPTDATDIEIPGPVHCYVLSGDDVLCPAYEETVRLHGDAYETFYYVHHPKGAIPLKRERMVELNERGRLMDVDVALAYEDWRLSENPFGVYRHTVALAA